ncbi:MAG TPA: hypothetical protein VHL09_14460, partial [Dehalococcoidia bacterium]|nr:hypothetical protein [Dehalococcoidia bacterium]
MIGRPGRARWGEILGAILAGLAIWQVAIVAVAARDVMLVTDRLAGGRLPTAEWPAEVKRLGGGLGVLRDRVAWLDPLLWPLARVPIVGPELGAARGLLGAGADLTAAAARLAGLVEADSGASAGGRTLTRAAASSMASGS